MPAAAASIDPDTLVRRLRGEARLLIERATGLRATSRQDAQMAAYGLESAADKLAAAADRIERTIDRPDRGDPDDR